MGKKEAVFGKIPNHHAGAAFLCKNVKHPLDSFLYLPVRIQNDFPRGTITQAQKILNQEIYRYNYHQVHSTTQEVPYFRFQRALKEGVSLFREFSIMPPYQSVKDIFCLRLNITINPYRKVSINNMVFKVNNATPGEQVNIRLYPINNGLSEMRFWCNGRLIDIQRAKNQDLNLPIS